MAYKKLLQNKGTSPVAGALCMGFTLIFVALILSDTADNPLSSGKNQVANVVVIHTQSLAGWREKGALTPQAGSRNSSAPIKVSDVSVPSLSASSFISVFVSAEDNEQILASRDEHAQFLIASITKLMTAFVARERYKGYDEMSVSAESLSESWPSGAYAPGTKLFFKDALYALLIPSHNEIGNAIAEREGKDEFVRLMNNKASELGLRDTRFINPTGLEEGGAGNLSTAFDIYTLARHIYNRFPDILSVTRHPEFQIFDIRGNFITAVKNTNLLLSDTGAPLSIIGGKTGSTPTAKQNLAIVAQAPCGGMVIAVVLRSDDSFADMKALLAYARDGWVWACRE